MMKKKGSIFLEALITLGLMSFVILPLIMLMNKNINRLSYLNEEQEIRKLSYNLEIVLNKTIDKTVSKKYILKRSSEEKDSFFLKENENIIITLKNIKLNFDPELSVEKRGISHNDHRLGYIFIMTLKVKNKIIERILVIQ